MTSILFTRGRSPISGLIQRLTRESVSHCAIGVGDWVLHATFTGVQWARRAEFEAHSVVVRAVEVPDNWARLIQAAAEHANRTRYDFRGLAYLGLRYTLRELFGWRLPKRNLWQTTGMFMCTEWVSGYLTGSEDSLITPGGLYTRLTGEALT